MSEPEPDLGLGTVVQVEAREITVHFATADALRRYARATAPLRRVRFEPGDRIRDHEGGSWVVERVEERDGLLVYHCGDIEITESLLADDMADEGPLERLLAGRLDQPELGRLRRQLHHHRNRILASPVRGLLGARIELLPHQLDVACEVSARLAPRVLLADEVGLGKTIEAGLIVHRLLVTGRASRVLVLVPDSLAHQWLVELRRRFELRFALFDEDRCRAITEADPGANPFADDQLVLASYDFLASSPPRSREAAAAGWDVVVVDEAHHLEWTREGAGPRYRAVAEVAATSPGLLLLTATPEQLGLEGHWARLHLLDPERFASLEDFQEEAAHYREVSAAAAVLIEGARLGDGEREALRRAFGGDCDDFDERWGAVVAGDHGARARLLDDLIDRHGTGRVMFRNTRASVPHFPERRVELHPLHTDISAVLAAAHAEVAADLGHGDAVEVFAFEDDPRLAWLVDLLARTAPARILVLCTTAAKAVALAEAVTSACGADVGVFHEGLSLVQRDRNAAWFASRDGARMLVCSEIGSEGRNFQFCQRLVLFDLPRSPDVVEQRIGRLDRIGQKQAIDIHVPWIAGSPAEVLVRWHHEGVDDFSHSVAGAAELGEEFATRLTDAALSGDGDVDELIAQTAARREELATRIRQGRDRLLELASHRPERAAAVLEAVRALDADPDIEELALRTLESFRVYAEEIDRDLFRLNPDALPIDEFPSLEDGTTVLTLDRRMALRREEVDFVTWDHPLLEDAIDRLLASDRGRAGFEVADRDGAPRLVLEADFLLECLAPARLHADRFLPPLPIVVAVDSETAPCAPREQGEPGEQPARGGDSGWLREQRRVLEPVLRRMLAGAEDQAQGRARGEIEQARRTARAALAREIERLTALARINPSVRPREIELLDEELRGLDAAISAARLRLDALTLRWEGASRNGRPVLAR